MGSKESKELEETKDLEIWNRHTTENQCASSETKILMEDKSDEDDEYLSIESDFNLLFSFSKASQPLLNLWIMHKKELINGVKNSLDNDFRWTRITGMIKYDKWVSLKEDLASNNPGVFKLLFMHKKHISREFSYASMMLYLSLDQMRLK